jgi:hypothetical protein
LDSREDVVAAADEDDGRPANHKPKLTSNPNSRTIPGYQVHTARSGRGLIRPYRAGKAEVRVDSARVSRDHEAHIALTAGDRFKTTKAGKAQAQADSVRAFKAEV